VTADAAVCGSVRSWSSGSNREEGRGQAFDGLTVVATPPTVWRSRYTSIKDVPSTKTRESG
jgi:hypothetical protein